MQEIWNPISFNENLLISSFGNLMTADTGKIWKIGVRKDGYSALTLYHRDIKKSKQHKIHRLVAEHFLDRVEGKTHINHKDFDKQNNNVSNLEWCTLRENVAHYFQHKYQHVVTDEKILFIRTNIEEIGARKMAALMQLDEGYVYGVANGTHRPDVYPELIREKRTSFPREVKKYNKKGVLIQTYNSISEAAKRNNAKLSYIQRVLCGQRGSYNGFVYKCDGYQQYPDINKLQRLIKLREKVESRYA